MSPEPDQATRFQPRVTGRCGPTITRYGMRARRRIHWKEITTRRGRRLPARQALNSCQRRTGFVSPSVTEFMSASPWAGLHGFNVTEQEIPLYEEGCPQGGVCSFLIPAPVIRPALLFCSSAWTERGRADTANRRLAFRTSPNLQGRDEPRIA